MLAKEYEMEQLKYSSKAIPLRGCNHPKFKWVDAAHTDRNEWIWDIVLFPSCRIPVNTKLVFICDISL